MMTISYDFLSYDHVYDDPNIGNGDHGDDDGDDDGGGDGGGDEEASQGPKNEDDGEELENIGVLHVRRHVGEHLNMIS